MGTIVYKVEILKPKIPRRIIQKIKEGAPYELELKRKKTKDGEVVTTKVKIK